MKTLYITSGYSNILIDQENNTATKLEPKRPSVDCMYLAKEPMHVVYGAGEYHKELNVDAGDIIFTFYGSDTERIVAFKSEEFKNIIEYREKKEQEAKERWAAEKLADPCENCCKLEA